MRLGVLDNGQSFGDKALFAFIRAVSRQPTPEILKLLAYRPDFLGNFLKRVTHEVMRGRSAWSVGDRELMAAVVSQANECAFCIGAHTAVAARAYGDRAKVDRALAANPDAGEPLRATLVLLRKLARERTVDAADMRAALAAGATRAQLEDALAVGFAFNTMNRLADAFGFAVPAPEVFAASAKFLLWRGYR
ncbi:MAG TPA: carboxymuconolactone decarboxylase family protein [Polyangia bacterium]|jgi:uncharacterized peroxidase-related enzyme|nr:carboxymuconolactone decarboxylase family protein [Polyangia bacterium]HWE29458.1 carboxymuconolactone decarboxylase family protein [Polyangia bacterium]